MTDYLTKEDLRSILREELPPIVTSIVTPIVTDAIKANNEILVPMIMSMVKEEIIAIYDEFGKIENRFEGIDKKFEAAHAELVDFKKDMNRQMSRIHSTVNMAVGYKSVIQDIDTRLYAMEQKAIYEKNKDEI